MAALNEQRICIGPKVPENIDSNPVSMVLPNPSSGLPSRYVIQNDRLHEIQVSESEGLRSWFVEDNILSDGSLYIITPIDPIFMFIPILDIMRQKSTESEGRFLMLDDIFESDQYTSLRRLRQLQNIERDLAMVCEVRDSSALKTFRLDNNMVMTWLKRKVESLVNKFGSVTVLVDSIAYTESLPAACRTGKGYHTVSSPTGVCISVRQLGYKIGWRIPVKLDKLESTTQLPTVADFGKRSGMDMDEDIRGSKEVKKPKLSVGQRKLAKASKAGMKPMSSYFAKKTA
ncbi:hypothetical protein BG011_001232 [Mortierella polycephala]|uniref:Ribonuclease H2 subunit B n=1 Tax=Mortierella polycephala TaxID=41804 RepID=A0A9P6Q961_9FUNG|nr:hypothetical protein BG011_001232 [Mortierella polycephala]